MARTSDPAAAPGAPGADPGPRDPARGVAYPGDRLMRIGAWTTAVGMVLTLVALIPLLLPSVHLPSAFWWLAMVTGVGLTLMAAGLWKSARARSRATISQIGPPPTRG